MDTRKRGSTPEMQVTSIRLETELKERLRQLSGEQGYQMLIRSILWQFVEQQTMSGALETNTIDRLHCSQSVLLPRSAILASFEATAHREERCAVSGQFIGRQQPMRLGLTTTGRIVPLQADVME